MTDGWEWEGEGPKIGEVGRGEKESCLAQAEKNVRGQEVFREVLLLAKG